MLLSYEHYLIIIKRCMHFMKIKVKRIEKEKKLDYVLIFE